MSLTTTKIFIGANPVFSELSYFCVSAFSDEILFFYDITECESECGRALTLRALRLVNFASVKIDIRHFDEIFE